MQSVKLSPEQIRPYPEVMSILLEHILPINSLLLKMIFTGSKDWKFDGPLSHNSCAKVEFYGTVVPLGILDKKKIMVP